VTLFILLMALGYLMGSICSAVIVCKVFSLPDPREEGSKNPGATNVLRIAGKHFAALVMLSDILKGAIPVVIARLLGADTVTVGFTALAAVIGHMYPVFFDFKGGKGVATTIGAILGIQIVAGTLVAATWLLIAKFTRYSSLASIFSVILAPLYAIIILNNINIFPPLAIITLLVLFKHRENITRLLDGAEPKITFDKHKHGVLDDVMVLPPLSGHEVANAGVEKPVAEVKSEKAKVKKPTTKTAKPKAPAKKTSATNKKAPKKEVKKETKKAPAKAKKTNKE